MKKLLTSDETTEIGIHANQMTNKGLSTYAHIMRSNANIWLGLNDNAVAKYTAKAHAYEQILTRRTEAAV